MRMKLLAFVLTAGGIAMCLPVNAETVGNIYTCGRSTVRESEVTEQDGKLSMKPVWSWTPAQSSGLPADFIRLFSTIDDCKSASNGTELLVTSSHDAAAIVSRNTGDTLFYARVKNAHSIVLLPDHLVAVASSDSTDGTGDRIFFFDRRLPDKPLAEQPLHAAHGLVWDEQRQVLWADGWDQLLKLHVARADGQLRIEILGQWQLPEQVGHDLRLSPACSSLVLSTTDHVYAFHMQDGSFSLFPPLGNVRDVKSISFGPRGRVAYTTADPGGYWTSTLRFEGQTLGISLAEPIYKVRWVDEAVQKCL